VACGEQIGGVGKINHGDLAARTLARGNRSVVADRYISLGCGKGQRTTRGYDRISGGCDKLPGAVQLKRAVARITGSGGCVYDEPTVAFDGDIERIAREFDLPLRQIYPGDA